MAICQLIRMHKQKLLPGKHAECCRKPTSQGRPFRAYPETNQVRGRALAQPSLLAPRTLRRRGSGGLPGASSSMGARIKSTWGNRMSRRGLDKHAAVPQLKARDDF